MSFNITSFIKALMPSINKTDLEADMEVSLKAVDSAIDSFINLKSIYSNHGFKNKLTKDLITSFNKEFKDTVHKVKVVNTVESFFTDQITLLNNVRLNGNYLLKELGDLSNEVIVTQALTLFKANLIRSVGHYFFLTRNALDIANLIYVYEAQAAGLSISKDAMPSPKQIERVIKTIWIQARVMSVYGEEHNLLGENLGNISKVAVPTDKIEEVIASFSPSKIDIFNNLPSGFVGSPIYTVRLIFAQWEAERYQALKDKSKLLELRYIHLQMLKEQGLADSGVEKEIAFIEKRAKDIDYKLAKMEEDVYV